MIPLIKILGMISEKLILTMILNIFCKFWKWKCITCFSVKIFHAFMRNRDITFINSCKHLDDMADRAYQAKHLKYFIILK